MYSVRLRTAVGQFCALVLLFAIRVDGLTCAEMSRQLVHAYRSATVGVPLELDAPAPLLAKETTLDPQKYLRNRFGKDISKEGIKNGLWEMESEVLRLFDEVPPEERGKEIKAFKKRFGFKNLEDAKDVLNYYWFSIYEGHPGVIAKPDAAYTRIQDLRRDYYLSSAQMGAPKHRLYFQANITKRTVPEMAIQLGKTQAEVYRDIRLSGLSIVEEFAPYRDQIIERLKRKIPVETIARELNFGEGALRYYLSHIRKHDKSQTWDRVATYGGLKQPEVNILLDMYDRGFSRKRMADSLNRIFKITNPDAAGFRTQASVQHKLEALGVTSEVSTVKDVEIPPYGHVKKDGVLVPGKVKSYLIGNPLKHPSEIAKELGVSPQALRQFILRNHHVRPGKADQSANDSARGALQNYETARKRTEEEALNNFITQFRRYDGRIPDSARPASQRTQEESDRRAAITYLYTHRWTEQQIAALPDEAMRARAQGIFDRRKKGVRVNKTAEESLQNFIKYFRKFDGKIPTVPKPASQKTEQEKDQHSASAYLQNQTWTEKKIAALPDEAMRMQARKYMERQRAGKKANRGRNSGLENFILQFRKFGGPIPHVTKPPKERTPEEIDQHAAARYLTAQKWTEKRIAELPDEAMRVQARLHFERQQRGEKLARNKKESFDIFVKYFRMYNGQIPPIRKNSIKMTPEQKEQDLAAGYINRKKWTEKTIAELPDEEMRRQAREVFERKKRGERLSRSRKNSLENFIHYFRKFNGHIPYVSKPAAQRTKEEKDQRAAAAYLVTQKWTEEKIAALPDEEMRVQARAIFENQKRDSDSQ